MRGNTLLRQVSIIFGKLWHVKWPLLLFIVPTIAGIGAYIIANVTTGHTESYPLTIKTDKHIYVTGSVINITVTNVSNETARFSNLAYELAFYRWNNLEWTRFKGIFGATVIGYLAPNESGYVVDRLKGYGWTFPSGQWRVGNRRANCWAEFSIIS